MALAPVQRQCVVSNPNSRFDSLKAWHLEGWKKVASLLASRISESSPRSEAVKELLSLRSVSKYFHENLFEKNLWPLFTKYFPLAFSAANSVSTAKSVPVDYQSFYQAQALQFPRLQPAPDVKNEYSSVGSAKIINDFLIESSEKTIKVSNLRNLKDITEIKKIIEVQADFIPNLTETNGTYLFVSSSSNSYIQGWDVSTGETFTFEDAQDTHCIQTILLRGNRLIVSKVKNPDISVWDIEKREQTHHISLHGRCYFLDADENYLILGDALEDLFISIREIGTDKVWDQSNLPLPKWIKWGDFFVHANSSLGITLSNFERKGSIEIANAHDDGIKKFEIWNDCLMSFSYAFFSADKLEIKMWDKQLTLLHHAEIPFNRSQVLDIQVCNNYLIISRTGNTMENMEVYYLPSLEKLSAFKHPDGVSYFHITREFFLMTSQSQNKFKLYPLSQMNSELSF